MFAFRASDAQTPQSADVPAGQVPERGLNAARAGQVGQTTKAGAGRSMRIIGIDPGLRCLGLGHRRGRWQPPAPCRERGNAARMAPTWRGRLLSLHVQLTEVVARHAPDAAAIEMTFVNRDGAGTLKLGQARGVAMLVPAAAGLSVAEYAPNAVKKAVVGAGHAEKAPDRPYGADAAARGRSGGPRRLRMRWPSRCATRSMPGVRTASRRPSPAEGQADDRKALGASGLHRVRSRAAGCERRRTTSSIAPTGRFAALPPKGEAVSLYTELLVREDLLQTFRLSQPLRSANGTVCWCPVQGVGAKASMAILGTLGAEGAARAVALGDWSAVRAAPGVGPKLAQRGGQRAEGQGAVGHGAGVAIRARRISWCPMAAPRRPHRKGRSPVRRRPRRCLRFRTSAMPPPMPRGPWPRWRAPHPRRTRPG